MKKDFSLSLEMTREIRNGKIKMKDEKLKSKKGEKNPLLNLPPGRGEKERGDFALSTCLSASLPVCRANGTGRLRQAG